jgi:hypothetical protein
MSTGAQKPPRIVFVVVLCYTGSVGQSWEVLAWMEAEEQADKVC